VSIATASERQSSIEKDNCVCPSGSLVQVNLDMAKDLKIRLHGATDANPRLAAYYYE